MQAMYTASKEHASLNLIDEGITENILVHKVKL